MVDQIEAESAQHPVPCHLTVMIGQKKGNAPPAARPAVFAVSGSRPDEPNISGPAR
jgi:hypothetical protein